MTPTREQNSFFQAFEAAPDFYDPSTPALIEPVWPATTPLQHRTLTYRELLDGVTRLASSLAKLGVGPGDRVILMVPMSIPLYQAMLAVLKVGGVCLFIDPSDGLVMVDRTARALEPKAYIGTPQAQKLRLVCPSLARIPLHVTTAPSSPAAELLEGLIAGGDPGFATVAVRADDAAIISFTSGSSGAPKGVRRTHHQLRAQFKMLCLHEGKRMLGVNFCAFPVLPIDDVSFGRTALLAAVKPGHVADADPALLLDQIKQYPPALVSCAPPMLEAILGEAERNKLTLASVKHVYTGGGPVPAGVIRRAKAVMPEAEINMIYGSTEAEPIAWMTGREVLEETAERTANGDGHCVGRLAPEVQLAIVRPSAEPLASLERVEGVGEVLVAGPHVNREYYENAEETRRHKVVADGNTWHRTGDLGYLDKTGRLWIVGRIVTQVVTQSGVLHPGQVEPVVEAVAGVKRAALIGVPVVRDGAAHTAAAVLAQLEPGADHLAVLARVRERIQERGMAVPWVAQTHAIPLDRRIGAKIQYRELVEKFGPLARQQLSDPFGPRLAAYLAERFPPKDTFFGALVFTLGIASLAVYPLWGIAHRVALATCAVFLFFFHLRVFDEQKDGARDRLTHPQRVLSRGIVNVQELTSLDGTGILVMALIALALGWSSFAWWLGAMAWAWLMRREFFLGDWLRERIVLYGISHVAVVFFLAQFVFAAMGGAAPALTAGALAMGLAWLQEIARKLDPTEAGKHVDVKDSDESYVRELGLSRTVLVVAGLELVTLVLALRLGEKVEAGLPFVTGVGAAVGLAGLATMGFANEPKRKTGKKVHGASLLLALVIYGLLAGRSLWR